MLGPLVLHTMPCQQMPTPWARGIPPGVSSTFHVLAWCRGHGKPEFSTPPTSPPDTHTRCLAASQGLHRFQGLHSLGTGAVWARVAWQLLPGPSVLRKQAKASFEARTFSLWDADHPEVGAPGLLSPREWGKSEAPGSQHLRRFFSLESKNPTWV